MAYLSALFSIFILATSLISSKHETVMVFAGWILLSFGVVFGFCGGYFTYGIVNCFHRLCIKGKGNSKRARVRVRDNELEEELDVEEQGVGSGKRASHNTSWIEAVKESMQEICLFLTKKYEKEGFSLDHISRCDYEDERGRHFDDAIVVYYGKR